MADQKKASNNVDLLEEDDEFEEFPAEGTTTTSTRVLYPSQSVSNKKQIGLDTAPVNK